MMMPIDKVNQDTPCGLEFSLAWQQAWHDVLFHRACKQARRLVSTVLDGCVPLIVLQELVFRNKPAATKFTLAI